MHRSAKGTRRQIHEVLGFCPATRADEEWLARQTKPVPVRVDGGRTRRLEVAFDAGPP
jgi:hypothetical protein